MSLVAWNSEMSVGVPSIDAQHQELLVILNNLHTATDEGHGASVVEETLEKLISYTVDHFNYEEKLFLETNYPDAKSHMKEHADLKQKVMEIKSKLLTGATDSLSQETSLLLVRWILNHTLGSDKSYSAHLIAAGIK